MWTLASSQTSTVFIKSSLNDMIRTLEQRVRYDDSQCLRRLEFDGEIIPRGLVTVGTGANDQYGFNYEFNVRFHPIECPVCDNPDGRSGSIAPTRDSQRSDRFLRG